MTYIMLGNKKTKKIFLVGFEGWTLKSNLKIEAQARKQTSKGMGAQPEETRSIIL